MFEPPPGDGPRAAAGATPAEVVQRQLDAYNAHDLEAFAACFSDDVRVFRMPAPLPETVGNAALRAFYAAHRFSIPTLRAELVARIAYGDKVADHERVHGLGDAPIEMMAVYQVRGGAIVNAWFFAA